MELLEKDRSIRDLDRSKQKLGDELDFAAREAYNLLKTNIEFSLTKKNDGEGFVIGITSSCPQEGKSYTSINLAYSIASDDNKVLLIDGDMRRPSVAKSLELDPVPGLANVLSATADVKKEDTIHKGVLHDNLDVVLSGTIPPNASKLIRSEEFKALIEKNPEENLGKLLYLNREDLTREDKQIYKTCRKEKHRKYMEQYITDIKGGMSVEEAKNELMAALK